MKKMKKRLLPCILVLILFLTAAGGFWYVNDYYHCEEGVQEIIQGDEKVAVFEIEEGLYFDGPGKDAAIIFYPGAKVEYTAYAPLLYALAGEGVDVFLAEMPCNLAFFGKDKARDIMAEYEYEQWYLAGHSLGGAMAASYASKHLDELDGLVLLAAYPTESLEADGFTVLSLYGSEDGVLNMEKVEDGRVMMPADYTEVCIEGGNHAWFGNYGEQKGDNPAKISREEQQGQTVEEILRMMPGNK